MAGASASPRHQKVWSLFGAALSQGEERAEAKD